MDADTETDLIVRILRMGQQRRSPPGPLLAGPVKSEDPSVRAAAATALGLTGDVALGEMLLSIKRDELEVGREVVTALGRLGYADGLPVVIEALAVAELREAAGIALARYGRHEVAMGDGGRDAIAKWTGDARAEVRYALAYALAYEHREDGEDGEDGDEKGEALLALFAEDESGETRAIALRGLARRQSVDDVRFGKALRDEDWRVRIEAVRGLMGADEAARAKAAGWFGGALDAMGWDTPMVHPVMTLSELLGAHVDETAVREAVDMAWKKNLGGSLGAAHVRCHLASARLRHGAPATDLLDCAERWPEARKLALLAVLVGEGVEVDRAALEASTDHEAVAARLQQRLAGDRKLDAETAGVYAKAILGSPDIMVVGTVLEALASAAGRIKPLPEGLAAALVERAGKEQDNLELVSSFLGALGKLEVKEGLSHCERALGHPNYTVRSAAADCVEKLTGGAPDPVELRPAPQLPFSPAQRVSFLAVETTAGTFEIRLDWQAAPMASAALVHLARAGAYDDTLWHRVVPNFVIQGGDPTGTGWGGPGFALPPEPSGVPYRRGTVGMADAGFGTAGSQWFVMHSAAPHLEGRYTVVGRVVSGLEVIDRILVGDRIMKVTIRGQREGGG